MHFNFFSSQTRINTQKFTAALFVFLCCGCLPSNHDDPDIVYAVSMIDLIANTEKYLDKKVVVSGFYNNVGFNLFISKDASSIMDYSSSISVISTTSNEDLLKACDLQYVTVEGVLILKESRKYLSEVNTIRLAKTGGQC